MSASNFHSGSSTKRASDLDANSVLTPKVIVAANTTAGAAPLPAGATPLAGNSGNVAAASAVATLANGADGTTLYLAGFRIDGLGATAAAVVGVTVACLLGGAMRGPFSVPA